MGNFKEDILHIKAFVFDCDGVFTDGGIIACSNGDISRKYNVKDGYAIAVARKRGYPVCIISGGEGDSIAARFRALGVEDIHLSSRHKQAAYEAFCHKYGLQNQQVLFMGDDIPDLVPMQLCGVPTAPCDAVFEVKAVAKYVSPYGGGKGCVRDVVEQVLKAQGQWGRGDLASVFSR